MSHLNILTFKYNLAKLKSKTGRPTVRQSSDLMKIYRPDNDEMKKVFDKIAGVAGRVSRKDMQALLERFGKADAANEARRMICVADYKKDGCMDFDEFMEVHRNGVLLADIRRAFFVFDTDGDGRISAEEVMDVLLKLGERCSLEDCMQMVKEIDRNHDGFVDMDDFMAMMTRPRKEP
ncbi:hypothetical protein ABZP36_035644 [Zizania latifolia]